MECWKTKCVSCGKEAPANECPQVGCFDGEKYQNSLCKKCWLMTNSNPDQERRNFYIVYRDEKVVHELTFDESWFLFTEALQSENPCSVFRHHDEMRVDR